MTVADACLIRVGADTRDKKNITTVTERGAAKGKSGLTTDRSRSKTAQIRSFAALHRATNIKVMDRPPFLGGFRVKAP